MNEFVVVIFGPQRAAGGRDQVRVRVKSTGDVISVPDVDGEAMLKAGTVFRYREYYPKAEAKQKARDTGGVQVMGRKSTVRSFLASLERDTERGDELGEKQGD
jgi:hypothetical protein